ncbi:MAG TPA: GNAT family N-acetyltransferase, partial [Candidatus Binataceae bacterium]
LAHAFQNDPLMAYTIPDATERATLLPEFYVRMVRFGFLSGEVYTTEGSIEGAAVWLPPGAKWDRQSVEAAGLHELSKIIGDDAMGRFREVVGAEARARERDMISPYWYLLLLGVAPNRQRRGLGGRLMEPILNQAMCEHVVCYLETEQPRNVAFYLKHGFEVVVDGEAAGVSGVRFWTFRRPKQNSPR